MSLQFVFTSFSLTPSLLYSAKRFDCIYVKCVKLLHGIYDYGDLDYRCYIVR